MSIQLNHILVQTSDIEAMVQFFEQSLDLTQGYRPPFGFRGAWLYADKQPMIHLSGIDRADTGQSDHLGNRKNASNIGTGIIDHIAFDGAGYPDLIKRLKLHKMKYFERSVPLSSEHQVFVEGPEGIRIEIQFEADQLGQIKTG